MAAHPLPIHERRLGTVGAYWGPAKTLAGAVAGSEAQQRIRTFSQTKWDEIVSALHLLHGIAGVAVVVHGPRGCSAVKHYLEAFDGTGGRLVSTNLTETDSIMGAEEKLEQAIRKVHDRHGAAVVFVVTTPVTAINNDDVLSVALELANELGIRVVPVFADGFKSKIGANGYDLAFHAAAARLVPERASTDEALVNIIMTAEHPADANYLSRIVSLMGLVPNIIPRFGSVAAFERSAQAALSVAMRSEGRLLGELLERERGVRFDHPLPPIGIGGVTDWLMRLGAHLGREHEAVSLVTVLADEVSADVERLRGTLAGARVYISGDGMVALSLADLVEHFGATVAGLSVFHLDEHTARAVKENYEQRGWNFDLHVGEGQPFEQVNILSRVRPDVYLGGLGQTVPVAKHGVPAVCYGSLPLYGHWAAADIVRRLHLAIENPSFVERLAAGASPYSGSWLRKNPNWHIKQEVR